MRLARLAVAAGAALALAGVALDVGAGGSRGFARPGGSTTPHAGAHPHGFHHFHGGIVVRGGFVVWPSAFYSWPGYYYPYPYYPPAYYPPAYYPPGYAPAYPAEQYWYYCPPVAAYYPYVQQCPTGWQPVRPAAPAPLG